MDMRSVSLPFDSVLRHTAGAVRQGVALEALLEQSRITPSHWDERDRVGPVQHLLLCMNTVLALGDATHGMARQRMDALYPVIGLHTALGSPTLESAILALARLYSTASNAVCIQLRTEQQHAILSVHMEARDEGDTAYLEENYLSWIFMQILHLLGREPAISLVTVRHPTYLSRGGLHWAIGARVVQGPITSFRFPRHLLGARPTARAGKNVMWECHQPWLALVADRSPPAPCSYVNDNGFVRFSELVREHGKTANTVRKYFRNAGGVFRDTRRSALVEAASERLRRGDESVETIAADLGYSDARSFRRFLKTATGLTPQQIRAERGAVAPADETEALEALEALCARMAV
ncbi:helix-turn-helix domain-containing protein [Caulobacter sp. KR2-114]|uniref:helix-turn-helix domain-containing protein n=1 Tax=Caulobacter sp. KR2-114 TaxID=3400912 RepID=UPI003C00177B